MLEFRKTRHGVPYLYRWFVDSPTPLSAFNLVYYMQCKRPGPIFLGFVRRQICVKVVDLRQDESSILSGMKSRTRTDVRRAEREGIELQINNDKDNFICFYNEFAEGKNGQIPMIDDQIHWGDNTVVLMVTYKGESLVMNHYVFDETIGRARMVYSAAQFRNLDDSEARNRIGRASRFLHYAAMRYFKNLGLYIYDLGEYDSSTRDGNVQKINRFKDSFGGHIEECYKVQTLPLFILQKIQKIIR